MIHGVDAELARLSESSQDPGIVILSEERERLLLTRNSMNLQGRVVTFCGFDVFVAPSIFDPSVGEGSKLLCSCLPEYGGATALEIGVGSGALTMKLASTFERVVGTDISEAAIDCCNFNFDRNGFQDKVEVRRGNLFDSITGVEKFDLVVFNPPFIDAVEGQKVWRPIHDKGFKSLKGFFARVSEFLMPRGCILLAFSNVGDLSLLRRLIADHHFSARMVALDEGKLSFFVLELQPMDGSQRSIRHAHLKSAC